MCAAVMTGRTRRVDHGPVVPPDPEVPERPQRRRFSAELKLAILREADACTEPGQIGALLRREGLYSSHLVDWRRQREAGTLEALSGRRGRKVGEDLDVVARSFRIEAHRLAPSLSVHAETPGRVDEEAWRRDEAPEHDGAGTIDRLPGDRLARRNRARGIRLNEPEASASDEKHLAARLATQVRTYSRRGPLWWTTLTSWTASRSSSPRSAPRCC